MKAYKLYIFDFDGTLVNSSKDLVKAVNFMRHHYKLAELTNQQIISYIGGGSKRLIQLAIKDSNLNLEEAHHIAMQYYNKNCWQNTHLYPQVEKTLLKLKKLGSKLAISTNKPLQFVKVIIAKLRLEHLFCEVLAPENSALKPDPKAINLLTEKLNISKSNTLMIGDHHTDIQAGINALCDSAFITYGFGHLPNNLSPTYRIDNFQQLYEKQAIFKMM